MFAKLVRSLVLISVLVFLFGMNSPKPAYAKGRGFASGKVKAPAAILEVEILASNSDYTNHIYLIYGGVETFIATDNDTGRIVCLPEVKKNKELVFEIRVFDGSVYTGVSWQSGPPSRNPDRARHVQLSNGSVRNSIVVAFEDIDASGWGVDDEPNFVDAVFEVRPGCTPTP